MRRTTTEMDDDKALLILKLGLVLENGRWFSKKENTHPAVVFTEHYVATHDVLAMLFRANKLCFGKLKYFRTNFDLFEPFKYDYEKGFIPTELWDAEFFRHRPTGYFIDLRFLQTITVFEEFVAFCRKLEDDQKKLFQSHMKWAEKGDNTSKSRSSVTTIDGPRCSRPAGSNSSVRIRFCSKNSSCSHTSQFS